MVSREAREVLNLVAAAGHPRFVLSSGCTLAVATPAENLDALLFEPLNSREEKLALGPL